MRVKATDESWRELRELDIFADCTDEELRTVNSLLTTVDIPAGRQIFTQGRGGLDCLIIVHGEAEISIDGTIVGTVGRGDILGEGAIMGDRCRNATVTAAAPIRAHVMHVGEFARLRQISSVRAKLDGVHHARSTPRPIRGGAVGLSLLSGRVEALIC